MVLTQFLLVGNAGKLLPAVLVLRLRELSAPQTALLPALCFAAHITILPQVFSWIPGGGEGRGLQIIILWFLANCGQ